MDNEEPINEDYKPSTIKTKLLVGVGILLFITGIIFMVVHFSYYQNWDEIRQLYENWGENYGASYAEDQAAFSFQFIIVGLIVTFIGLLFIKFGKKFKMKYLFSDYRMFNSIKFSIAVISIICGIFLILMLFYRYYFYFKRLGSEWISAFHPELYYPIIFIPEGLILLMLGIILLFISRWQVRNEINNKNLNSITKWLIVLIIIFVVIFIVGLVIGSYIHGSYALFGPWFGLILLPFIIFLSFYIFHRISKMNGIKNEIPDKSNKTNKKLLDSKDVDYVTITTILLVVCIVSPIPVFLHEPVTSYCYYWEDSWDHKVALPGMNVTYNLTFEHHEGDSNFKCAIVEMDDGIEGNWDDIDGNWSISSKEVIVKPNEKKTIIFTNFIPSDTPPFESYSYHFYLVEIGDNGPNSGGTWSVSTFVTHNVSYYNDSQQSGASVWRNWGVSSPSFEFFGLLTVLTFIAWIAISIIYFKIWEKS